MLRPDVLAFLADHEWVATAAELRELGVSASALARARKRGLITSPIQGMVVLGGARLSVAGKMRLAALGAGGEAFVSGQTAGSLHGLRGMSTSKVEITVHERRRLTEYPAWCRIVRTSWIDDGDVEIREPDDLRVASPLRTLFGLAAQFNQHRFERAAEDAWHRGLATPEQAWDYLQAIRRSGRAGVRTMETWLEKAALRDRPAQSNLELDLIDVVERMGLPAPKRQHPLVLVSGETVHLDIAWPDVRLAVEPGHSWWHGGDLGQRRDQARDRACTAVGWMVIRFDEDARRDLAGAGREVADTYRRRRADSPES